MSDITAELRFIVHLEETTTGSTPLLTFSADVVRVIDGGKLRNPSWTSAYGDPDQHGELDSFSISAQAEPTNGAWYGMRAEYRQPYGVELDRAEVMVKTLRKVRKGLDKHEQTYGYVTDLVTFVTRIAQTLGIAGYVRKVRPPSDGWSYDAGEYRFMDANALRYHIAREVSEWRKRHGVTVEA